MSIESRLLQAAEDFCKEESAIRTSRGKFPRCTKKGEVDFVDSPPCYLDPGSPQCDACVDRAKGIVIYRGSLRKRYLAKERMLRAYARLPFARMIEAMQQFPGGPAAYARAFNDLTPEQIREHQEKSKISTDLRSSTRSGDRVK